MNIHYKYKEKMKYFIIVDLYEEQVWNRGYIWKEYPLGVITRVKALEWNRLNSDNPTKGLKLDKHGWKTEKGAKRHLEKYNDIIKNGKVIQVSKIEYSKTFFKKCK